MFLRALALLVVSGLALAACQSDAPPPLEAGTTASPAAIDGARAACEAAGGEFTTPPGATGAVLICVRVPDDANTPCATSDECDGFCLARSRTCAPFVPLFGCNDVLNSAGIETNVCVN